MFYVFIFVAFILFGLVFGSFFGVLSYRIPRGESFLISRSHCDMCDHELFTGDLIPLFSYISLQGKCRYCGEKYDAFIFYSELVTGILFGFLFYKFGFTIELAIHLVFISVLIINTFSDLIYMEVIPPVIWSGTAIILLLQIISGTFSWSLFIFGVVLFGVFFLVHKLGYMGGGDVRLMPLFGLVLGYIGFYDLISYSSFIGIILYYTDLLPKENKRLPMVPLFLIGAICHYVFSLGLFAF